MLEAGHLIELVKKYNPKTNHKLLLNAYNKCKDWHGSQKRKSGEAYYTHPIAVAHEIIKMQLDDTTIVTALLHDVIEDTSITFKDIEDEFSLEIAELVDGVTKLEKINFQIDQVKQAENFRKLFLALAKDIRVLVVKLCDRLHNMRTLEHKSSPAIKRIAVETLEIYAPLAERIGMYEISNELQDLSFGAINSRARNSIVRRLEQIKSKSLDGNVVDNVISELNTMLKSEGIICTIKGREKSPYSIWKKLIKKGATFENLIDVIGFRIITNNQRDCYLALGAIHGSYKAIPNTFVDYISLPKQNGYKSIHTVVIGPFSQRIEIQIRTEEMDTEAEYGLAAHWSYKQSVSKKEEIKKGMELWIKTMLEILKTSNNAQEFLEITKLEIYNQQIFAFTPEGDIIDLPQGATILDFAFAVHTELGCFCTGAKINNNIVGIDYKIQNGDQIKILTSKASWPSLDWLKIAITGRAKHSIKKATKDEQEDNLKAKGCEILSRLFASYNYKIDDKIINKLLNVTDKKNIDELYLEVANNAIDITKIVKKTFPEILHVKNAFLDISSFNGIGHNRVVSEKSIQTTNWIESYKINGLPECFAKKLCICCKPDIGDSAIGVSIPSEAIFIHKNTCQNIKHCYTGDTILINNLLITK